MTLVNYLYVGIAIGVLAVAIYASVNKYKDLKEEAIHGEHGKESHGQKKERHIREKRNKKRKLRAAIRR